MLKPESAQFGITLRNLVLFWVDISSSITLMVIRLDIALFFWKIFMQFVRLENKSTNRQNLNNLKFRNSLFKRKFYFDYFETKFLEAL